MDYVCDDDLIDDISEALSRYYRYEVNDIFISSVELASESGDDLEVVFSFTAYGHELIENCIAWIGADINVSVSL